ncbi:hypothetical protein CBL_03083 [Carabus blaptoides fortunei]
MCQEVLVPPTCKNPGPNNCPSVTRISVTIAAPRTLRLTYKTLRSTAGKSLPRFDLASRLTVPTLVYSVVSNSISGITSWIIDLFSPVGHRVRDTAPRGILTYGPGTGRSVPNDPFSFRPNQPPPTLSKLTPTP